MSHSPWLFARVLALRITQPGLERPFRAQAIWSVRRPAARNFNLPDVRPGRRDLGEAGGRCGLRLAS